MKSEYNFGRFPVYVGKNGILMKNNGMKKLKIEGETEQLKTESKLRHEERLNGRMKAKISKKKFLK